MPKQCFEGLLHAGLPEMDAAHGLWKMPMITRTAYPGWTDPLGMPDASWYDALSIAQHPLRNWIMVNQETWPIDTQANRQLMAQRFVTVYTEIKARRPDLSICFYGSLPRRDFWRAVPYPQQPSLHIWRSENNDIAATLAPVVDAFTPSLYFFYDKATNGQEVVDMFRRYVRMHMNEMKRLRDTYGHGQPIYPYIWWRRQDDAKDLDLDIWRDMVRIVYQEADGFVLWGGWKTTPPAGPIPWDENAPWWSWLRPRLPGKDVLMGDL